MNQVLVKSKKYSVREINRADYPIWDKFILQTPQYSIFSSSKWVEVLAKFTNAKMSIIGCYKGSELVAGVNLFLRRNLEGTTATCPPFSQYCGVHINERQSKIVSKADSQAINSSSALIDYLEQRLDYAILINHPGLKDIRQFQWRNWNSEVRYTYYLLLNNLEQLSAKISPSVHRQIKKAERSNFTVVSDKISLDKFYNFWSEALDYRGIAMPISKGGLIALFEEFPQNFKTYAIEDNNGNYICALIYIIDRDTAFYWASASGEEGFKSGANQYLLWNSLKDLSAICEKVDFVGADTPSIAHYKSTFGGEIISHYKVSKAISLRAKAVRCAKMLYYHFKKGKIEKTNYR